MKIKSRPDSYLTYKQIDEMEETSLAMFILLLNRRLEELNSDRLYEISGQRLVKGKAS